MCTDLNMLHIHISEGMLVLAFLLNFIPCVIDLYLVNKSSISLTSCTLLFEWEKKNYTIVHHLVVSFSFLFKN